MNQSPHALDELKHALGMRDRAGVNLAIERLLKLPARRGATWKSLATAASRNGEHSLALAAIDRLVAEFPDDPQAQLDRAAFLTKAGRIDRARAVVEALSASFPGSPEINYLLGTIALNQGRTDDAQALLAAVATASPASGQAWLALANVAPEGGSPATGDAILSADRTVSAANPDDRAQYLYARGKVLADRRDHPAAFAAFAEGAALLAAQRPYDAQAATMRAQQAIAQFDRAFFDKIRLSSQPSRAIFVTGLPRSGTTLVEHILSSSGNVTAGGELALFRLLHQDLGGSDANSIAAFAGRHTLAPLADLYDHLLGQRFDTGRVVDKSLLAGNYMGLLLAMFPDAPIVWLRRNPIDNGWSCFRTYFVAGLGWTNSQESIARTMRLQERLLQHWNRIADGRILTVDLERLTDNPEVEIKRIAGHCGVAFDQSMLNPELSDRTVATASTAQVRAPINRQGIGASDPYRNFLAPMIDAYEDTAING